MVIAFFLSMSTCGFTFAADGEWTIRAVPSYFVTASSKSAVVTTLPAPSGTESNSHTVDGDAGIGIGLEYRITERIGIEGAAFLSNHDTQMVISNDLGTFSATDSTRFRLFTLGANYYFPTADSMQWSVGAFVPLVFADGTDHIFPGLGRT